MCHFLCRLYKNIQVNIKTIHSSSEVAFDWPIMIKNAQEKFFKNTPLAFKRSRNNKRFSTLLNKKKV